MLSVGVGLNQSCSRLTPQTTPLKTHINTHTHIHTHWPLSYMERPYASKFGKLSSSHRTGKGQFSFQSQRKAMPKNVQTIIQLHSFHMLERVCSKFFKLGFSSTWTKNLQMHKLDLGKAEEPDIKLPTSGHRKSKRIQKNIYFCFLDCAQAFNCMDHKKLQKIL